MNPFYLAELTANGLANTPHSPVRYQDTIGIVVEQDRPTDLKDSIRWYCEECKEIVYQKDFHMHDLGTQVKEAILEFQSSEDNRRCKNCGAMASATPKK